MDIYLAGCFMFVFLSLVKLAIVKYMWKKMRKREGFALCSLPDSPFEFTESGGFAVAQREQQQQPMNGHCASNRRSTRCGSAAVSAGVSFALDAFGADAIRRMNLKKSIEINGLLASRRKSTATFLKVARVHDRYWKCAKAFHIGSQVVFPILFASFAIFFFLIYAKLYVPVRECFERE